MNPPLFGNRYSRVRLHRIGVTWCNLGFTWARASGTIHLMLPWIDIDIHLNQYYRNTFGAKWHHWDYRRSLRTPRQ